VSPASGAGKPKNEIHDSRKGNEGIRRRCLICCARAGPRRAIGLREVRVAAKSSFAFNGIISTRTFCKSLISPNVGLLPQLASDLAAAVLLALYRIWYPDCFAS
jgi:hypothetical protein